MSDPKPCDEICGRLQERHDHMAPLLATLLDAKSWIEALQAQVAELKIHLSRLEADRARLETGILFENDEVTQALGKALGYPWFKDDQKNFPGATEAHGVCVGEHQPGTLATEAAGRIKTLEAEVKQLKAEKAAGCSCWPMFPLALPSTWTITGGDGGTVFEWADRDELAALRKDKARLDWIEKVRAEPYYVRLYQFSRSASVMLDTEYDNVLFVGQTARAAIDAAIKEKP